MKKKDYCSYIFDPLIGIILLKKKWRKIEETKIFHTKNTISDFLSDDMDSHLFDIYFRGDRENF